MIDESNDNKKQSMLMLSLLLMANIDVIDNQFIMSVIALLY